MSERTLWSCMACGAVGDRQSCHACGAEAMPGAWVPADQLQQMKAENERLRQTLIPFAFIGRDSMEPLGLAEEYDQARDLLGLAMTAEQLQSAQGKVRHLDEDLRQATMRRDAMIRQALRSGWTHARIADATELSRGRVGQIAQAYTRELLM
jgi:hypothetical protein